MPSFEAKYYLPFYHYCNCHHAIHSLVVVLAAVGPVLLVQGDHLAVQPAPAHAAAETLLVEPGVPHHQRRVAV